MTHSHARDQYRDQRASDANVTVTKVEEPLERQKIVALDGRIREAY
jgi:hypothetical protein